MATTSVSDTKFISPGSVPFTLTITVGFAQAGGSYVVLIDNHGNRTVIPPTTEGVYNVQMPLQSILSCITTVQDINLSTNDTSVDHVFSFHQPNQFTFSKRVEHQNDKVVYDIQYVNL